MIMIRHWCHDPQLALQTPVVIVINICRYCGDQCLPAGETMAVIHFPFQDAPKAFHRSIVDAMGNPGHALLHVIGLQTHPERGAGILEPAVAVEQRMGIRFQTDGLIKGRHHQGIIVMVPDCRCDDPTVVQVQDGT